MEKLYILTKQEFNSLYRFGQVPLVSEYIISCENKTDKEIESNLFKTFLKLPLFVGDEEYLIINFKNELIKNKWLEIENVLEVIPLTRAAKHSFELKFDSRIRFRKPYFEHIVHQIEEQIDILERYRGAKAFWELCRVSQPFKRIIPNEIIEATYKKRIIGLQSNQFQEDFWVHLLVYERYNFYPNTDLGYFYDIGEAFAHSKGKPTFKGSGYYNFLETQKESLSQRTFLEIAEIISKNKSISKFTTQLTSSNIKQYLSAAIFLKFKEDLKGLDSIKNSETGKLIGKIRKQKNLINELNFAIYLTGAFFGYKKFYDDFYNLVRLNIFKEKLVKREVIIDKTTFNSPEINPSPEKGKPEGSCKPDNDHLLSEVIKKIKNLFDDNDKFEIKKEKLKGLKKILAPIYKKGKITRKDQVIQILKDDFRTEFELEQKGNKYYIGSKSNGNLFNNI